MKRIFLGMVMICSAAAGEVKIVQPVTEVEGVGATVVLEVEGIRYAIAADKIELKQDGSLVAVGSWEISDGKTLVLPPNETYTVTFSINGKIQFKGAGGRRFFGGANEEKTPAASKKSTWVMKQFE